MIIRIKAGTKLVRLDLVNTKLTRQQDEAILGTLNEGCKMEKTILATKIC